MRQPWKIIIWFIVLSLISFDYAHSQTSTDIFIMPGSDFVRPGSHARSNFNIGIGTYTKTPLGKIIGNESTLSYTYENAGSHGFWHTTNGSHTEALGTMKNISLTKRTGLYTWEQLGVTSFTGNSKVQNRFYFGESLGLMYHFNDRNGIWIQEQYNKINTIPWYTTTSIGYVYSF